MCNMTTNNVTVREFIQKYLIDQIEDVKNSHPYFAFLLMAVGIEFLGRCQSSKGWNDPKQNASVYFKDGLDVAPLNKYRVKYPDLYHQLRCGLAHAYHPEGIILSDKEGASDISCEEFYADFVDACKNILAGNAPKTIRDLDVPFFAVTTTDDGTSTTATTASPICQTQN